MTVSLRLCIGCAKVMLNDSTPADWDADFIVLEALCLVLAAIDFPAHILFRLCRAGLFSRYLGSMSCVQTFLERRNRPRNFCFRTIGANDIANNRFAADVWD